jgi:predicted glycosyltransferase
MRILIDIGHPGHVHLFKNLITNLKLKRNDFLITARDKEVSLSLLKSLDLKYYNRGKGYNSILGKALGMLVIDFKILKQAIKFKPDILIGGVGNAYIAQVARLIGKPSIIFDDTEHAKFELAFVKRLSSCIVTPDIYKLDLGKNQIRYSGFHELAYLHPRYFSPDKSILRILNVNSEEKYYILRFVSWNASHDIGQTGLNIEEKRQLVDLLKKKGKVFISSENKLSEEFETYRFNLSPDKMHDALAFADLFIGEGATMSSECAILGTPAIYINTISAGTLEDQEKYRLLYNFRNFHGVIEKVNELLSLPNLRDEFQARRNRMFADKIDVTAFMVWFVENYPESFKIMKENPKYQLNFK